MSYLLIYLQVLKDKPDARKQIALPGVYPLSTVRLENGIGLRLNLLWVNPHDGEGRIPGYWEESRAGTGMALTTAGTKRQQLMTQQSIFHLPSTSVVEQAGSDSFFLRPRLDCRVARQREECLDFFQPQSFSRVNILLWLLRIKRETSERGVVRKAGITRSGRHVPRNAFWSFQMLKDRPYKMSFKNSTIYFEAITFMYLQYFNLLQLQLDSMCSAQNLKAQSCTQLIKHLRAT